MITYTDAYLKNLVTQDREDRAAEYVDTFGTFAEAHRNRLIEIRAYIITCIDSMKAADDMFSVKLEHYREEWGIELAVAQAAQATETGAALRTIEIERA